MFSYLNGKKKVKSIPLTKRVGKVFCLEEEENKEIEKLIQSCKKQENSFYMEALKFLTTNGIAIEDEELLLNKLIENELFQISFLLALTTTADTKVIITCLQLLQRLGEIYSKSFEFFQTLQDTGILSILLNILVQERNNNDPNSIHNFILLILATISASEDTEVKLRLVQILKEKKMFSILLHFALLNEFENSLRIFHNLALNEISGKLLLEYLIEENLFEDDFLSLIRIKSVRWSEKEIFLSILWNFSCYSSAILKEHPKYFDLCSDLFDSLNNAKDQMTMLAALANVYTKNSSTNGDLLSKEKGLHIFREFLLLVHGAMNEDHEIIDPPSLYEMLKCLSNYFQLIETRNQVLRYDPNILSTLERILFVSWLQNVNTRIFRVSFDCITPFYRDEEAWAVLTRKRSFESLERGFEYYNLIISFLAIKLIKRIGKNSKLKLLPMDLIILIFDFYFPPQLQECT